MTKSSEEAARRKRVRDAALLVCAALKKATVYDVAECLRAGGDEVRNASVAVVLNALVRKKQLSSPRKGVYTALQPVPQPQPIANGRRAAMMAGSAYRAPRSAGKTTP